MRIREVGIDSQRLMAIPNGLLYTALAYKNTCHVIVWVLIERRNPKSLRIVDNSLLHSSALF